MADVVVGSVTRRLAGGRRWRAVAFLALAAGVALVGVAGGTLAGMVPGSAHAMQSMQLSRPSRSSQPSTNTRPTQASATATTTSTPVSQGCDCVGETLIVPQPKAGVPKIGGQVILVSLSQQWLWAYQDQHLALASPVTTGMPQLPTPRGDYSVQRKERDVMFYSYWPPSSPFYYSPEHINYAMFFRDKGYYIHDAPWRHAFGPGTEYPHTNPDGTHETGSHGCVNMPTPAAAALYNWVGLGAHIIVVA